MHSFFFKVSIDFEIVVGVGVGIGMMAISMFLVVGMMAVSVIVCGTRIRSVVDCGMISRSVRVDRMGIGLGCLFFYFLRFGDCVILAQIRSNGELGKSIALLFSLNDIFYCET